MFSNNSSKPSEFFKSKSEYDKILPSNIDEKAIDIWYDVPYFGKIDAFGMPVYPREVLLGSLDVDGKFQAIKFVATAFKTLQSFINYQKSKNKFESSFLGDFTPKKSWESATLLFDQYFENNIYNAFLNNYLTGKTIPSFKCFVKEYMNFCKLVSKDVSLTFSSFVLSSNCTNKISGLIIDLSNDSHSDTAKKVNDYYNDYQYIKFLNICERYGFKVNKNAPWQLIADLSNTQMRKFAAAEGIDTRQNGLFNRLYYNCGKQIGYETFKKQLWGMYSDWFSVNTTYSDIKVESKFNSFSPMFSQFTTVKVDELPVELSIEEDDFFNLYGELYFLNLYFKIRLIEAGMENKYSNLIHYLKEYYNLGGHPFGRDMALDFINKKVIKTNIYTSAVSGEGLDDFNPYFFNDNPLTSENTSANMTQNINSPPSVINGGGSNSGY